MWNLWRWVLTLGTIDELWEHVTNAITDVITSWKGEHE